MPFAKSQKQPLRLAYNTGTFQSGELYLPAQPGPYPVVILIHGGYWRSHFGLDLMHGLARDLVARQIAVWNIEYRRVGNPGGGWPGTFLDVAQAADYLRTIATTYELDLARVIPIGHSAGGHLALWLAARSHIPAHSSIYPHEHPQTLSGAISLAGVINLEMAYQLHLSNDAVVGLLGGTLEQTPERYIAASPAALLPLHIPQVLIHGTADANVPIEVSQAYGAAARAAGDTIISLEPAGVDHFDIINPATKIWEATVQELEKLLK